MHLSYEPCLVTIDPLSPPPIFPPKLKAEFSEPAPLLLPPVVANHHHSDINVINDLHSGVRILSLCTFLELAMSVSSLYL